MLYCSQMKMMRVFMVHEPPDSGNYRGFLFLFGEGGLIPRLATYPLCSTISNI